MTWIECLDADSQLPSEAKADPAVPGSSLIEDVQLKLLRDGTVFLLFWRQVVARSAFIEWTCQNQS